MKISETIEKTREIICNDYCKYPCQPVPDGKDQDWLYTDEDSPCMQCPLNEL